MEEQNLPVIPPTPLPVNVPESSNYKTYLIWGGILVLLVLLIVGALFLMQTKSSTTSNTANPVVEKTTPPLPIPVVSDNVSSITPLETDTKTIDGQLNSLDNDLNNVNSGLNDQQGDLSE